MFELRSNSASNRIDIEDIKIDISAESRDGEGELDDKTQERDEERILLAGSRCPLLGHLVQIAQVGTFELTIPFHTIPYHSIAIHIKYITSFNHSNTMCTGDWNCLSR